MGQHMSANAKTGNQSDLLLWVAGGVIAAVVIGIVDLSQMELTARVNELDIAGVRTGQKATISVDALPGETIEGEVVYISPVASAPAGVLLFEDDTEPKKYDVKINFNAQADSGLRSGMSATAEITIE